METTYPTLPTPQGNSLMSDRSANHQSEERKLEQDHRRERNHKYKWALGEVDPDSAHLKARPVKPHNTS